MEKTVRSAVCAFQDDQLTRPAPSHPSAACRPLARSRSRRSKGTTINVNAHIACYATASAYFPRAAVRPAVLFLQQSTNEACTASQTNTATPILLLHGLTYSSHEFDVQYQTYSLVNGLLRECKTVWSLDIAGYGRSAPIADGFEPDTDYAADDIRAAVQYITNNQNDQTEGDVQVDLLGWSWGTITATRYIENYPNDHNVRRAVLYAPLIHAFDGKPEQLDAFHANNWDHAASDFQVDGDGNIDYTIVEPAAVHEFLSNCWRYDQNTSPNGGRRDLLAGSDVQLFDPSQIDVPVLMIGGSEDPLLYFDLLEEVFNQLPKKEDSEMVIVEGAGHILMLEKDYHQEFQDAVVDFLR